MTNEIRRTTCVLDCPDNCALEVEVEEGRITKIGGSREHPNTAGFICGKVGGFHRRLEHPDRLLYPERRVGAKGSGRYERISWDEAIEEIRERLTLIRDGWGGEAILPFNYGGSNGLLSDGLVDTLFFARLGASRLEKTICAAPTTAVAKGMYGKMPGVAFEDYVHARAILVWGANPKASNIHLVPYLKEAKARGAFVAVVDPRRNFSDGEVDLHLPVLPGTDLPVALALIGHWDRSGQLDREFLDRNATGLGPLLERATEWTLERAASVAAVEVADLRKLADRFADATPAVLRCGWGLERNRNGGQAAAAVLAIPALLGKFGVRGGGYSMSNSGSWSFDPRSVLGEGEWTTRSLNMTRLGRWLNAGRDELEPPIQALFVYNANPVATVPGQDAILRGLARADLFTVVFEQVRTDTAVWADVVLPAATFLEAHDLRAGYGAYVLGGVAPVVEPMGEARSNMAVFGALGRAMGFEDAAFGLDDAELLRRVATNTAPWSDHADVRSLEAGGFQGHDFPGPSPVQFLTTHPRTDDGRIHLAPAVLGPEPYRFHESENDFPLALISPASSKLISSTFGESNLPELVATIHPRDADRRGVATGDLVRVFNDLGEVVCGAEVSARVRAGVVSMPKGAWRKASKNRATSTALCPDHLNEVAGGACFNDARVEIEKV